MTGAPSLGNSWMDGYPTVCEYCGGKMLRTMRDGRSQQWHSETVNGRRVRHVWHTECKPAPRP